MYIYIYIHIDKHTFIDIHTCIYIQGAYDKFKDFLPMGI